VTEPRRAFEEALEDLLEAGRPVTSRLLQDLQSKHEAYVAWDAQMLPEPGSFLVKGPPPTPREEVLGKIDRRVGFEVEPPAVAEAEPAPVANNPPHVWKPGPKPSLIPPEIEAAIVQQRIDPDVPERTQEQIAGDHGVSRDQVKYWEGRIRARLGRARKRSG
jgi:hypothetical protein